MGGVDLGFVLANLDRLLLFRIDLSENNIDKSNFEVRLMQAALAKHPR